MRNVTQNSLPARKNIWQNAPRPELEHLNAPRPELVHQRTALLHVSFVVLYRTPNRVCDDELSLGGVIVVRSTTC